MPNDRIIVSEIDYKALEQQLKARKEAAIAQIVKTLAYVGEQCVTIAREDHAGNWNDVTGNLRSSIGYVVLVDGKPANAEGLENQFRRFPTQKGDGSKGQEEAEKLLRSLQSTYDKGVVLIVVAGMKYASYVEDVRHKVVLSEARLLAEQLVSQLLRSFIK